MLWPGSKPDCKGFRILAGVLFCYFLGTTLSMAIPISERWDKSQLYSHSFQEGNSEKWNLKLYCSWCGIFKSSLIFLICLFLFVLLTVTISSEQQHLGISWPSLPYLGVLDGSEKHEFLRPKPPTLICLKLMSETQYCTDRTHCL